MMDAELSWINPAQMPVNSLIEVYYIGDADLCGPPSTRGNAGGKEAARAYAGPHSAKIGADGDGGAGDDGGIIVVGIGHVQAALHSLYRDVADG